MVEMADTSLESLPGKVLEVKPDVNALTTSIGALGLEKLMLQIVSQFKFARYNPEIK